MGTFEPVTVPEITQYAEVTEDLCLALRGRDEALETTPYQVKSGSGGNSTSSFTTVLSLPVTAFPAWANRVTVRLKHKVTVGAGSPGSIETRLSGGGNTSPVTSTSSEAGVERSLTLDLGTLIGTDGTVNVQTRVASGSPDEATVETVRYFFIWRE